MALDQTTKQNVKNNFDQIKTQLQQRYPDMQESDFTQGKNDPDKLVEAVAKRTGESKSSVEQQIKQLA